LGQVVEARGEDFGTFINEGSCNLYGAPVGIFCFTEPGEPAARRLDCGIWLAYLLLGAHAQGLGSCPVGLLAAYEDVVKDVLFVPEEYHFACAVALGYPSVDDPVNTFDCPRKGIDGVEWV
jgi:nitroreductase